MLLIQHVHPISQVRYLDLRSGPGERFEAFSPICAITYVSVGTLMRVGAGDVLIKFVDELHAGDIRLRLYYGSAVLQSLWVEGRKLTNPTYDEFVSGDRVLATSAGILLGLLPAIRR